MGRSSVPALCYCALSRIHVFWLCSVWTIPYKGKPLFYSDNIKLNTKVNSFKTLQIAESA